MSTEGVNTTVAKESRRKLGQWKGAYQKYFAIAFVLAALLHLLTTFSYYVATHQESNEMSVSVERSDYDLIQPPVKFELRAPRLAKSFSVSKTPSYTQAFSPREIKFAPTQVTRVEQTAPTRSTAQSSGKASRVEGSIFYGAMTGGSNAEASWGIPGGALAFGRSLGVGGKLGWGEGQTAGVDFQPDINEEVSNSRTAGSSGLASLRDELVSYENLSDRFDVLVEQDPRNKKKVTGMLNFYQLRWKSTRNEPNGEEGWNAFPRALLTLVDYARDSTDVRINLSGNIRLDDKQLLTIPVLFMMGFVAAVQYTPQETQNLGKWLRKGGVLVIDDGYAQTSGAFNKSVRALLKDALGYDAEFERIPSNHWLYHCWEDFDGPPPGLDNINFPVSPSRIVEVNKQLEGIFLNGRLAVLISNKGYTHAWGEWRYITPQYDNTRQLHFGVNIIVFACTVKGGINDQNKAKLANETQRK
ncbi:MAG: DUF4159 domain-containing protein [Bacteroidota bacterium]